MKIRTAFFLIYTITLILLLTCSDPGLWDLLDRQAGLEPGLNPTLPVILPFRTPGPTPQITPTTTPEITQIPNKAPIAGNDTTSTLEDLAVTIDVLENDSDPDGDSISILGANAPSNGTSAIDTDYIIYTPDADFFGSDSFSYTITDTKGGTATGTVTVIITGVNDAPVGSDDSISTAMNSPVTVDALANDTDKDGDSLSIVGVTNGTNGTSDINANRVIYTPEADYTGTDIFTYTVSDGNGGTAIGTVTVSVILSPGVPTAVNDYANTEEDEPVNIDVLANDTHPNMDPLIISSVSNATNGTATINGGQITYTPDTNYNGIDTFTYVVKDLNDDTGTATVTVTIIAVNDDPVAVDDSAIVDEDTSVEIDVLANDTDVEGDVLSIAGVGTAPNGTPVIDGNRVLYTPKIHFFGTDTFSYTISDSNGGTDTATVIITVTAINDPPLGVDDSAATNEDVPVNIDVLVNDTDPDGDTLSIAGVGSASNGVAEININQVTYTPDNGFYGTDSFIYTVSDGNGGTDTAIVSITIYEMNDDPVTADDSAITAEDTQTIIDVLANDSDPDGDPLNIVNAGNPPNGTASITMNHVTYTPDADFNGIDIFGYTVSDGNGGTDSGTVTVTVTGVNDDPVAENDSAVTNEDNAVNINVLANDTDIDGDILTITGVGNPSNGTAVINGEQITYTPDTGFNGTDTFSYTVSDGNGGSDTANINVTVYGINDDPVAENDSAITDEDTPVQIDVLANDTDPDEDSLSIASAGTPSGGAAVINSNKITYTPNANFNGTDTFSYTISDGNGGTDSATVTVTINGVNDNPVAENDSAATNEDNAVNIYVLA
ncbi:MAG: tandem-95 repeat protein, partial [Spirochaetales bacterium]|nr:tandem-95 repeat protein [Spirochaetales bacterium]